MLEFLFIAFLLAVVGSLAAGICDIRTTEVPDEISFLMAAGGFILWFLFAATTGDFMPLILSVLFGGGLLLFGWILYKLGQWGGGDAKLLAAIFCLLPIVGIFISFVFNFFIVAVAYIVVYILVLAFKHKRIYGIWKKAVVHNKFFLFGISILSACVAILVISSVLYPFLLMMTIFVFLIDMLVIFISFSKVVEKNLFFRKIPISKLRVGDVLASSKQWDGISKAQLLKLKKTKRFVEIKEGVRFTLVFPLTLIVTWLIGNMLFLIVGG
ncbi:MAG: A24 family peptidase [Candidatus Aenigmatarchaeota archaeon]